MDQTQAISEMQAMLNLAIGEDRAFTPVEQTRFDILRQFCESNILVAGLQPSEPANPTRAVAGAARSLSQACMADGLIARMMATGSEWLRQ